MNRGGKPSTSAVGNGPWTCGVGHHLFIGLLEFILRSASISFHQGFSLFVFSLLAATTVIFHYSIMFWVGLKTNVTVSMRTSIDGILLQAYFTGAQSYLPLASDMELTGSLEDKQECSNITLLALLGLSLLMDSIGTLFFAPVLKIWGAHLLLYVFVISFPLKPLRRIGHFCSFQRDVVVHISAGVADILFNMPEAFYAIL